MRTDERRPVNPEQPTNSTEDILAYLEGDMEQDACSAFVARLRVDAVLTHEFEVYRDLFGDLEAVGRALEPLQPSALPADEIAGYVSEDLDEVAQRRVKHRLDKDPFASREVTELGEMGGMLRDMGAALAASVPKVDLLEGVLSKVAQLKMSGLDTESFPAETESLLDAFVDDALGQHAAARLEELCDLDLQVGEARFGLCQLKSDLDSIGAAVRESTQEVDIVEAVMSRVHETKTVSPLRTRAKGRPVPTFSSGAVWRYASLAAAAGLIFAFWIWPALRQTATSPLDKPLAHETSGRVSVPNTRTAHMPHSVSPSANNAPHEATLQAEANSPSDVVRHTEKTVSMQDALETYRSAMQGDVKATQRLARLSLISAEKARVIVGRPNALLNAKIGASQFLPPAEANPILIAAVEQDTKDFHARLMLASKDAESGAYDAGMQDRLKSWATADRSNALPLYLESRALLTQDPQGNRAAAFDALDRAAERPSASVYAVEHANRQEQALASTGLDEKAALFLAAATLGNDAYSTVTGLGKSLIDAGTRFEFDGDYAGAEHMYQAVAQLGAQVMVSALASQERLAGLDVSKSAYASLESLYTATGDPAQAQSVREDAAQVAVAMEELGQQLEVYNALLIDGSSQNALDVARETLLHGDVAVQERLK